MSSGLFNQYKLTIDILPGIFFDDDLFIVLFFMVIIALLKVGVCLKNYYWQPVC